MQTEQDLSKIERLKKALYSRTTPAIIRARKTFLKPHNEIPVQDNWKEDEANFTSIDADAEFRTGRRKLSFFKIVFMLSLLFFLISGGYALYLFLNGGNLISAQNVDIKITGPVNISGGVPFDFDVEVYNKNDVMLEIVDLQLEFPSGTANPQKPEEELQRVKKMLGDINPGKSSKASFGAILFGGEGDKKEIKVTISYHVRGSNAILEKNRIYETYIKTSPVNVLIKTNNEVVSGQDLNIKYEINSNSTEVLKNVLVKASYPFGFAYKDSSVKPYSANNIWYIGDLPPGSKKVISIDGNMLGQDDENRAFRFEIGSRSTKSDVEIGTTFIKSEQIITVKKPFISTKIVMDGKETDKYPTNSGKNVNVSIFFKNNLDVAISNAKLKVNLSGNALKPEAVFVQDGIYRVSEKVITWDKFTNSALSNLEPGEEGEVKFSIVPSESSGSSVNLIKNPQVTIKLSFDGDRSSETGVPTAINSFDEASILIISKAFVSGLVYYDEGPFNNKGHVPPTVDNETTYTVLWTLTTTSSNIDNAKVEADLPPWVEWTAKIEPSDKENVIFDPISKHITWNIGRLDAYTGSKNNKELYFQLALKPTLNQVGTTPVILKNIKISGKDEFSGVDIVNIVSDLTTKLADTKSSIEDATVSE